MTRLPLTSTQANRGRALEELVLQTNEQYAARGLAAIQRIWTPTRVIRQGKQIVSAFHAAKSTVDFTGVYQGQALAFDVKSTRLKHRWPLRNLDAHQLAYMTAWQDRGGVSFILLEFALYDETYLVPLKVLVEHVADNAASLSLITCRQQAVLCRQGSRGYYLDYLAALDRVLGGERR